MAAGREPKTCQSCGREVTWRKSLERNWAEVRYCSAACRRRKLTAEDLALTDAIRDLLLGRSASASITPDDAAEVVGGREGSQELREPARRAARRLVAAGEVEMVQDGRVVDPSTARGPFRIRRARS